MRATAQASGIDLDEMRDQADEEYAQAIQPVKDKLAAAKAAVRAATRELKTTRTAAVAKRRETKAAAEASLGRELADKPRLLALVRGALIHRVGEDVMVVATATDETVRALLGEVGTEALPAFDSP